MADATVTGVAGTATAAGVSPTLPGVDVVVYINAAHAYALDIRTGGFDTTVTATAGEASAAGGTPVDAVTVITAAGEASAAAGTPGYQATWDATIAGVVGTASAEAVAPGYVISWNATVVGVVGTAFAVAVAPGYTAVSPVGLIHWTLNERNTSWTVEAV